MQILVNSILGNKGLGPSLIPMEASTQILSCSHGEKVILLHITAQ